MSKLLVVAGVLVGAVWSAPTAKAQYIVGPPLYVAPRVATYRVVPSTVYMAPAPVMAYRAVPTMVLPPVTVYRAPVVTTPVIVGRPGYGYYSPYGGAEVRVPGQPLRNTLRAIVP
ncbi:MAG: hypothetical protein AB7F89_18810 [Pirellulaceae bacterium]